VHAHEHKTYVLILRPDPTCRVPDIIGLRRLLKCLLRNFGLVAVDVREVGATTHGTANASDAQGRHDRESMVASDAPPTQQRASCGHSAGASLKGTPPGKGIRRVGGGRNPTDFAPRIDAASASLDKRREKQGSAACTPALAQVSGYTTAFCHSEKSGIPARVYPPEHLLREGPRIDVAAAEGTSDTPTDCGVACGKEAANRRGRFSVPVSNEQPPACPAGDQQWALQTK
jgi:hypothetical protein